MIHKIKRIKKDIVKSVVSFLLMLVAVLTSVTSAMPFFAFAESSKNYETSDPLADLSASSDFDINKYPFDEKGELTFHSLNEYCYSYSPSLSANFALYIYVYNPARLDVDTASNFNTIQLATAYDGEGKPTEYSKYKLKFCAKSGASFAGLFYKFKIIDNLVGGKSIYDRVNGAERRYDVSGLELVVNGKILAEDHAIARTYYWTGYAEGYGPREQTGSTLSCRYEKLETAKLDVKHTYWRSESSNKGAGYQNQLDSVYFSVPNAFLREYGKLQKIKAEWWEYKTKDIIVTSDQTAYYEVLPFVGKTVNTTDCDRGFVHWVESISEFAYDWAYNINCNTADNMTIEKLYYLFHTVDWCNIKEYDPYSDVVSSGGISGNALYDYILNYDKTFDAGTLEAKDQKISADLFQSDIDASRKIDNEHGKIQKGYSYYDFDADVDILEWSKYRPGDHSFADNVSMFGFWQALFGQTAVNDVNGEGVAPILMLQESDVNGNASDIAKNLYVNANDVEEIQQAYKDATANDETLVLFRFALSDYFSQELEIWCNDLFGVTGEWTGLAYRAQQSVFLNFDLIQLTFNNEGDLTVIPVSANPVDIVNDITTPTHMSNNGLPLWLVLLIAGVLLVLIIILLWPFWPAILKAIGVAIKWIAIGIYYVYASPFLLVNWLISWGG